jgi:serine/threonine protein kinase
MVSMVANKPNCKTLAPDVAKRIVQILEDDVSDLLNSSRVLNSHTLSSIATFHHNEIHLGNLIATGTFSEVYEVKSLDALKAYNDVADEERRQNRLQVSAESTERKKGPISKPPFVLKHLRPRYLSRAPRKFKTAARDLLVEAQYLVALQHPHIVHIRGVAPFGEMAYLSGRHDAYYIIMERMECTLVDRILLWNRQMRCMSYEMVHKISSNHRHLVFAGRLQVVAQIASALSYLHDRGMVYRDLKPNNIGFDTNGVVKLLDLGLVAEIPRHVGFLTERCGTQRYMAKEVYYGEPYDYKADVFSLSIVLWEVMALTRCFGFLNTNAHRIEVMERGKREPLHHSWPYGVRSLIRRGWSNRPKARPTMLEFHQELIQELTELKTRDGALRQEQPTRLYEEVSMQKPITSYY